MKKINLFIGVLGLLLTGSGCIADHIFRCENGRGNRITEILTLDDFDEIQLWVDAQVFITQGTGHQIEVIAQSNIIDELDFRVRNGTLVIDHDRCLRSYRTIEIHLTMEQINALSISGSGSITGENLFTTDEIELSISGSGDMDLGLDVYKITSRISGSGDIKLEGSTHELDHLVSGSGQLFAFDLATLRASIRISGSGDVEVNVEEFLDAQISGSGDVYYLGDPELDIRISGSGEVYHAR